MYVNFFCFDILEKTNLKCLTELFTSRLKLLHLTYKAIVSGFRESLISHLHFQILTNVKACLQSPNSFMHISVCKFIDLLNSVCVYKITSLR